MTQRNEQTELQRLKQGIDEELSPKKPTLPRKICGIVYRYKFLLLAAVVIIVGVELLIGNGNTQEREVYSSGEDMSGAVTEATQEKEEADMSVMCLSSDPELLSQMKDNREMIELAIEQRYSQGTNEESIHCDLRFIDGNSFSADEFLKPDDDQYFTNYPMFCIADKATIEEIRNNKDNYVIFSDISSFSEKSPNIDGIYCKLEGTGFAKLCGWERSVPTTCVSLL